MAVRDGSFAAARRDHWYVGCFRQLHKSLFRVRPRHSATREYQGQAGLSYDVGRFPKLFRARHNSRDRSRITQLDFVTLHPGLGRNIDKNGTGPPSAHLSERFGHGIWDISRRRCEPPPLGNRLHRSRLVRDFVIDL